MGRCRWTEERERALIAFYSEHSCLWNKRSEDHNNRRLRLSLLEALSRQLSEHTAPVSVDDIKCKFKNLRTVFNREYKSVQASRTSGRVYLSKWKHYQQLLFLCESCDEDERLEEGQALEPQDQKESEGGHLVTSIRGRNRPSSRTQPDKFSRSSTPWDEEGMHRSAACQTSPDKSSPSCQTSAPAMHLSPSASARSDAGPSVDSRSHWSDAKVQQLLSFYSEHSCLWNHRSESYRNRLLKQSLLELLSSLLSEGEPVPFTVEDIKTKFRNLRTIFQREHKVVTSNKTCGSEDFYLPKWKHYRELMFLCDSCDDEELQESDVQLPDPQVSPFPLLHHGDLQSSPELDVPSQSLETPPSPTPPHSHRSSPSSSPHPESRGHKRASRELPRSGGELLNFMRTFGQSQTPSPHTGFLKYVEECLNETPPDKVRKLKKKIIEMIHSVSEEV